MNLKHLTQVNLSYNKHMKIENPITCEDCSFVSVYNKLAIEDKTTYKYE